MNKKETPAVSVVVPTYNTGHFLKWTLDSIQGQTCKDFECIVVDDASTDNSIASIKSILKDTRFKLIHHKVNSGLSAARNSGLRVARGKFIAFLDADDLMMSNSLEVRLATCRWAERTSDRFVGSYCGSQSIEEDCKTAPQSEPQALPFIDFISSNGLCPFNANQPMLRRDILRASGGFNQSLKQAEDFDLWQRILRAGYSFAPAKHCSVTYRKRHGSMIRSQPLTHLTTSLAITDSADRSATPDQLNWSPYRMPRPLGEYKGQIRKVDRILEFVGMALSGPNKDELDKLADIISSELPDLRQIMNPAKTPEQGIRNGIARQRGNVDEESERRLQSLLQKLPPDPLPASGDNIAGKIYGDVSKDRYWFADLQRKYDIVFIPHREYHVWTISLLAEKLKEIGVEFITVDISPEWRDGGVRQAAAEHGIELIGMSEFTLGQYAPRAIVTFNDWDPVTRPILTAAKTAGIRTIAIVEGIQDYDDADMHWERFAYKTSDVVLLPGDFDRKYFTKYDITVDVGGVPRIEALRQKPPRAWSKSPKPRVLINSNFSYGVLEQHRDDWLADCVEVVRELGMEPVISRHPGDKGELYPEYVTGMNFYDALENCDVSVQRFASGVLEALTREVGVIYFNPHGEKVDKFQTDPMDAYVLALSREELRASLMSWWELHERAKRNGGAFLDHHAGELSGGVVTRCAMALQQHLGTKPDRAALRVFHRCIEAIDMETQAFFQVRPEGVPLFPNPANAVEQLQKICKAYEALVGVRPEVIEMARSSVPAARQCIPARQKSLVDLTTLSAQLLLDPQTGLKTLHAQSNEIERTLSAMPKDDPLLQHFQRVRNFAEACGG